MARVKTITLVFLITMMMSTWVLSSDALSQKAVFPNLQGSEERGTSPTTLRSICHQLSIAELVKLCGYLRLEELPDIPGLKIKDLISFAKAVRGPVKTFTNPAKFKKISQNPEQLVRRLGFDQVDQLSKVRPGSILVVKWVRLDELSNFQSGNDPDKLMQFGNRIIVPLIIPENNGTGEQALSSLTFGLFRDENEWRWTRRGAPQRIRKIYNYRNDSQELVEIPGLNLRFIKKRANGTVGLIPLYNSKFEGLELQVGVEQPASQIFVGLVTEARKIIAASRLGKRPGLR